MKESTDSPMRAPKAENENSLPQSTGLQAKAYKRDLKGKRNRIESDSSMESEPNDGEFFSETELNDFLKG